MIRYFPTYSYRSDGMGHQGWLRYQGFCQISVFWRSLFYPVSGKATPCHVDIFVDDIMQIDPQIGNRLNIVANTVGSTARGAF